MVCRDNFFNVKYAIDMAELTESYIKGFVETCFKAGVHEKQAAAMLDLVAESSAMEKSAAPSFWKGIGQLISGTGNVIGGAGMGLLGGSSKVIKPIGKGISWANDKYMTQPIKHYAKNKDFLAAFTHAGTYGVLPPAIGLTAFQNWRANSDSDIATAINDYLGNPEFLVFGNGTGGNGSGISTAVTTAGGGGYYTPTSVDSPLNIPGTSTYTPGEAALLGTATGGAAGSMAVPASLLPILEERREVANALRNIGSSASSSVSATRRARSGTTAAERELKERARMLDEQLNRGIADHNTQVAINNRNLKQQQAKAEAEYASAVRQDRYQSGIGINSDNIAARAVNAGLEAIGVRDSDADTVRRDQDIRDKGKARDEINRRAPEKPIDARAFNTMKEKNYGGRI
jgi:hypothetical protein